MKKTIVTLGLAGIVACTPFMSAGIAHAAPAQQAVNGYSSNGQAVWNQMWNWFVTLKPVGNAEMYPDTQNGTQTVTQNGVQQEQISQPNGGNTNHDAVTAEAFATQVAELVNQERAKEGLSPLTMDAKLSEVAMLKAQDMYDNNYFDHQSPTYGSPFDMMRANGITYQTAGENIAKGQRSPQEVMDAWMNSEGHRKNIMNADFTTIGVAYYNGEWVQQFIG